MKVQHTHIHTHRHTCSCTRMCTHTHTHQPSSLVMLRLHSVKYSPVFKRRQWKTGGLFFHQPPGILVLNDTLWKASGCWAFLRRTKTWRTFCAGHLFNQVPEWVYQGLWRVQFKLGGGGGGFECWCKGKSLFSLICEPLRSGLQPPAPLQSTVHHLHMQTVLMCVKILV